MPGTLRFALCESRAVAADLIPAGSGSGQHSPQWKIGNRILDTTPTRQWHHGFESHTSTVRCYSRNQFGSPQGNSIGCIFPRGSLPPPPPVLFVRSTPSSCRLLSFFRSPFVSLHVFALQGDGFGLNHQSAHHLHTLRWTLGHTLPRFSPSAGLGTAQLSLGQNHVSGNSSVV